MSRVWKMVRVTERFAERREYKIPGAPSEFYEVNMERLSCGHTRRDPFDFYGNETSVKIKRAFEIFSPESPIKARCYECGRQKTAEGR